MVCQAFLEHDESSDAAVAVKKGLIFVMPRLVKLIWLNYASESEGILFLTKLV